MVNWLPDGGRVDWSTGADHSDRGGVGGGGCVECSLVMLHAFQ